MPSGSGAALRFRVLGFPVRVGWSFLLVLAFLGWTGSFRLDRLLLWVAVGAVSILLHELGHAVVARTTGAEPVIDLYGFGGVTRFAPAREPSRLRSIAISLAGPLLGVAIGLVLLFGVPADSLEPGTLARYARDAAVFVNLGWGVLNLLPVLPLDGGQTLYHLLPGSAATRQRTAAVVSVAVAGAAALYSVHRGYLYGAFLAGFFALSNLATARGPKAAAAPVPPTEPGELDRGVLYLLDQGKPEQARHLLATAPPGQPVDLAVAGLVDAVSGRPRVGAETVSRAYGQAPGNPLRAGCYARLLVYTQAWTELRALVAGPAGGLLPVELVAWAQGAAFHAGAYADAAALAEPVLHRAGPAAARLAYNAACAWSRSGEPERALASLAAAVDLGWRDGGLAESDDDLAAVRALPQWPALRARMAA